MEEDELLFIPPMLIQPYIENCIEHGFSGIDYQGQITILLSLQEKFITCVVEDNGKGIRSGSVSDSNATSTKLISEFILKTTKQEINVINKADHSPGTHGLRVEFLIPFKLTEDD